jgi:hypothetical protein
MSSFSGIGLVPLKSVASLKLVISVCVTGLQRRPVSVLESQPHSK